MRFREQKEMLRQEYVSLLAAGRPDRSVNKKSIQHAFKLHHFNPKRPLQNNGNYLLL